MRIALNGEALVLDPSGVLWWPRRRLLAVADLHLEKGSAFARRGSFLPPYDTELTLDRLEAAIDRLAPATVVSLGDGFHDRRGPGELSPGLRDRLCGLVARRQWIWITGNHDPAIPLALGAAALPALELDGLRFVHVPSAARGEVAGHLHPKAKVQGRGRALSRRCFAADRHALVLPAFGAFTGGLNVCDPAFRDLFPGGFHAYLLGDQRVFRLPHDCLTAERDAKRHLLDGPA